MQPAGANWFDGFFKIPELRKRLTFTFLTLIAYRIGIFVPTPGIDAHKLKRIMEESSASLFGMINMFSGGALDNFSIFALGIMPYISVSIIIQLLTTAVPRLEELKKEGESGRRIITRYTRIGTVALALFQGTMISIGLEHQGVVLAGHQGWSFRLMTAITLTAGTIFIMWLGEQITERGIGNGISLIIFAGIVARMPATLVRTFDLVNSGELGWMTMWLLLLFGLATIAVIVYVERCQRRIPVQYPRRAVSGRMMTQAATQYLPLKLNSSGVIPAIFASTFLVFPATIAQFSGNEWLRDALSWLAYRSYTYDVVFVGLVIFFCYFYTAVVFDPEKIAEDLKKNGGFVHGVRPGKETGAYLNTVLSRLTLWGALYVSAVCILPTLFYTSMGARGFDAFFGGTAVLIVVGVTMDTVAQIQSHIVARNYEAFMNKGPGKMRAHGRGMGGPSRLITR